MCFPTEESTDTTLFCSSPPLGLSRRVPVYLVSWEWFTRQRPPEESCLIFFPLSSLELYFSDSTPIKFLNWREQETVIKTMHKEALAIQQGQSYGPFVLKEKFREFSWALTGFFCLQLKNRAGTTLPCNLYNSLKCYIYICT